LSDAQRRTARPSTGRATVEQHGRTRRNEGIFSRVLFPAISATTAAANRHDQIDQRRAWHRPARRGDIILNVANAIDVDGSGGNTSHCWRRQLRNPASGHDHRLGGTAFALSAMAMSRSPPTVDLAHSRKRHRIEPRGRYRQHQASPPQRVRRSPHRRLGPPVGRTRPDRNCCVPSRSRPGPHGSGKFTIVTVPTHPPTVPASTQNIALGLGTGATITSTASSLGRSGFWPSHRRGTLGSMVKRTRSPTASRASHLLGCRAFTSSRARPDKSSCAGRSRPCDRRPQ